jgi:hypothetical protein
LPTGPAYAGPVQPPAPAANPQTADAGPDAIARAKRNLPIGPTYASALDSAPTPPVKSQAVVALGEPDAASDASAVEPHSAIGAKVFAPLPPPRPTDLDVAVALADAPMPPARPANLLLSSQPQGTGPDVSWPAPSNKGPGVGGAVAQRGGLPPVITYGIYGIDGAPTGALALAEGSPARKYDDGVLLARAAELTAPIPPMPIPNVGAPGRAPEKAAASPLKQAGGGAAQSAAMSAEDLARLFGGLPSSEAFKTSAPTAPGGADLRGSQQ